MANAPLPVTVNINIKVPVDLKLQLMRHTNIFYLNKSDILSDSFLCIELKIVILPELFFQI